MTSRDPGHRQERRPVQAVSGIQPLSAIVEGETVVREMQVRVLAGFAAISCLLAGVGL